MFVLRHPRGWPADSFATERTASTRRRPPVKVRISRVGFDGVTSPSAALFVPFLCVVLFGCFWPPSGTHRTCFVSFSTSPSRPFSVVSRVFLSYADGCTAAAINTVPGRNLAVAEVFLPCFTFRLHDKWQLTPVSCGGTHPTHISSRNKISTRWSPSLPETSTVDLVIRTSQRKRKTVFHSTK